MAQSVCFYFQVHQPFRVSKGSFLTDECPEYFDGPEKYRNEDVFIKVAQKCYLPMTSLLLELLEKHPEFQISFSFSGVFLEQCERYGETGANVLRHFQRLVETGRVEVLSETYYHSLAFLHSKLEFAEQVEFHKHTVERLFEVTPKVFRNTELIFSDELAEFVRLLGFKGILAEGWHTVLPDGNANILRKAHTIDLPQSDKNIAKQYTPKNWLGFRKKPEKYLTVLTKNHQLADDMAFRFGDKNWAEYPLTADRYAHWIEVAQGDTVNLFMDFETFGEHQWEDTGIFEFFRHLPTHCFERGITFRTPSNTIRDFETKGVFSSPQYLSWADEHRDISAWLENDLQKSAFDEIHSIEQVLHPYRKSKHPEHQKMWDDFRKLQTSDHLYYMCTKYWADGDVHAYFSPYESPYEAFMHYMNILERLKKRVEQLEG